MWRQIDPVEGCTYEFAVNFCPTPRLMTAVVSLRGARPNSLELYTHGNSFDFCVYAESCGIGLVWDDLLQPCVPSEEFVEALQINACGEGTYWNEELGICLPIDSCPEDLNGDGITGTEDLLIAFSIWRCLSSNLVQHELLIQSRMGIRCRWVPYGYHHRIMGSFRWKVVEFADKQQVPLSVIYAMPKVVLEDKL